MALAALPGAELEDPELAAASTGVAAANHARLRGYLAQGGLAKRRPERLHRPRLARVRPPGEHLPALQQATLERTGPSRPALVQPARWPGGRLATRGRVTREGAVQGRSALKRPGVSLAALQ